ncbi:MAG TPA: MauE/DoxX family redox-associated membrane protein [Flavipsychrobacter sp.]|nr:MauE/DoxX family redox-associated membrane protein [Flavipsychrobacter sp.]
MNKFTHIFLITLSVFVGAVFLYSASTKLNSIFSFEYTIVGFVHLPWFFAAVAARILCGLEAALGTLLILNIYGRRKWVLKTAITLLIIFSLYLIYLWVKEGNQVNCGCFGDAIWMSPASSLIKNVLLIIATIILLLFNNGLGKKWANIVSLSLLVILIALPFFLYEIPNQQPTWLQKDKFKLNLSSLYAPGKKDIPKIDLYKGKYIIAFLSPTCPHCQMAAYKMHLMKQNNPSLPFFMVIGGSMDLSDFWAKSKAQNIPYTRLDKDKFLKLIGFSFPVIDWVNNDWVEAQTPYISLNQKEIEKWLK